MIHNATLADLLGTGIKDLRPRAGGDAADAFDCVTDEGDLLFVKTVSKGSPFPMEALGLERLRTEEGVRVPKVIAVSDTVLVLERIDFGSPASGFQEELGRRLALTHQACSHDAYGFDEDHWIGATPQVNQPWVAYTPNSGAEFWWTHRLEPMLRRLDDPDLTRLGTQLEQRLPEVLGTIHSPPCLIHGDLWSGNVGADAEGAPVMFDPAPSYSPREAELGMTQLFGRFSPAFYAAYDETFPLPEGWQERQNVYMLYHVLNHAVLFGSGYARQAHRLITQYV